MSTESRGLNLWVKEKFGADHPNARPVFAQGDINTTMIRTRNGCAVTLYYDSHSPRPYDLGFHVQGTKGIYSHSLNSVYVEGRSHQDAWESIEHYRNEYEHPLWKKFGEAARRATDMAAQTTSHSTGSSGPCEGEPNRNRTYMTPRTGA